MTGGTGVVGGAVLRRLVAQGRTVVALARSERSSRSLTALGARAAPGDVMDPPSLAAAMEGCEVVYHAAGLNASCLRDPSVLFDVNVRGSGHVIEAAARAGVRRVIYTSSAATVGERPGEVGREDSLHRGWFLSHYERSKFDAERVVMERAGVLGVEAVSVNPTSVQGPGRADGSARLLVLFLTGRLRFFVRTRLSLIDIDDCAVGHVRAERHGRPGERYLLSGASLELEDALALLARITGVERRPRPIPRTIASAAGALAEVASGITGRPLPLCREVVRTLLHGHTYDGSRAARELGVRYTPVEDTLRRTVAWLVAEGVVPQSSVRWN
ncbi:MAG: NAD-dependent epimerase/dehydratase family protein [Actinomycetota bacterium]|nr:NAD-dependent epimerase/dehydratase family protein [Actinomycetota bacterium]